MSAGGIYGYSGPMPKGATRPEPDDLSRAVSAIIKSVMRDKTRSGRSVSSAVGLGHSTGALLYSGKMAWTLPELEAVCAELRQVTSDVVAKAEMDRRRRRLTVVTPDVDTAAADESPDEAKEREERGET